MAGTGTARQRAVRVRLMRLLLVSPLLVIDFLAISRGHAGAFLVGLVAVFPMSIAVTAVALAAALSLGARVVYLRIGVGPVLRRSATGDRLVVLGSIPLGWGCLYLPATAKFGRDFRLLSAFQLGAYLVALVAGALLLPPYGAAVFCWAAVLTLVVTMLARDPSTGRRMIARVALRPTPQTDPALADPLRAVSECAGIDAQYGDLIAAERVLAGLRASSAPQEGTALLESEILTVRGEFAAAAELEIPIAADASETLRAARTARNHSRALRLLMLAVEKDPALAPQLLPKALEHAKRATAKPYRMASPDRTGRALFLLRQKKTAAALREARFALRSARTPLATADALCTLAVISSVQRKPKAARSLLARAARVAPWYPRLTTVQQIVAQRAGAAVLPAVPVAADTSVLFDDPWATPSHD